MTNAILQAQRQCRARQSGTAALARADRLWSGLNAGQRLQVVGGLARAQLGASIPIRVYPPNQRIRNVARVTGKGRTVSIIFGTAGANSRRSLLDEPLIKPASLGWSYRNLLDFLCYENEIARIRHQIGPVCLKMYNSVKARMDKDKSRAYVTNVKDPAQTRAQIASYKQFMASYYAYYKSGQIRPLAAAWLFERIAVQRGKGAKSCDMPFGTEGKIYNSAISPQLIFDYDTLAGQRGRAFCPCPR